MLEIIVITIGILGAFALNNWNETRKQLKEEESFLINLQKDLLLDSAQFVYYLEEYERIEGLHIQLYRIGILKEVLDSINETTLIRRKLYFKQLIDKEFKEKANDLSNERVREELIAYTRLVYDFEDQYFIELSPVFNRIRSYLAEHKVYNTDNWFAIKSRVFEGYTFKELDDQNIVDKDGLIELSKTEEFQQILFELNVKWSEFHSRLLPLMEGNNKLRSVIKEEMINY